MEKLRQVLRSMADLMPLTRLGCVVFIAGLASWWVWVEGSHDFVLRAALIALALVMLACLATTVIGTLLTIKSVEAGHVFKSQCETGQRLQTNVRLPRMRFWPLIQVDLAWSNPSFMQATLTHDGPSWLESARATGRGRSSVIDRRVTVKDIFGFTAITLKHHQSAVLSVYPNRTPVQLQPALRDSDGDGSSHPVGAPVGDYVEMRRYGPGDPHRLILWRAFARSRRLLVRTPERAVVPLPNAAAFFVSGDADDAPLLRSRELCSSKAFSGKTSSLAQPVPQSRFGTVNRRSTPLLTQPPIATEPGRTYRLSSHNSMTADDANAFFSYRVNPVAGSSLCSLKYRDCERLRSFSWRWMHR